MNINEWLVTLSDNLRKLGVDSVSYLPNILKAIALLVVGWIVARISRTLVKKVLTKLAKKISKMKGQESQVGSRLDSLISEVVNRIVFWTVFMLFLAAAANALNLPVITGVLRNVAYYLPAVFIAVIVILAGVVIGNVARSGIKTATISLGIRQAEFIGHSARIIILLTAFVIAMDQVGIDSTIIVYVSTIFFGTFIGGAALAFGLGARTAVSNIIATHYLRQNFQIGQRIKIHDIKGKIVEFQNTTVVLDSPDGLVYVPSKEFNEHVSTLLDERTQNEK